MQEPRNTLRVLRETLEALKKQDYLKIHQLSSQTIHSASMAGDGDDIAVAVLIYALSKIIQREEYKAHKDWGKLYKLILRTISGAINCLETNKPGCFRAKLELINKSLEKISGKLSKYIKDVFQKARINKASKIYEHGISLETTSKMLGVTMWDLATYAGSKNLGDAPGSRTIGTKTRIKLVEELFDLR